MYSYEIIESDAVILRRVGTILLLFLRPNKPVINAFCMLERLTSELYNSITASLAFRSTSYNAFSILWFVFVEETLTSSSGAEEPIGYMS